MQGAAGTCAQENKGRNIQIAELHDTLNHDDGRATPVGFIAETGHG